MASNKYFVSSPMVDDCDLYKSDETVQSKPYVMDLLVVKDDAFMVDKKYVNATNLNFSSDENVIISDRDVLEKETNNVPDVEHVVSDGNKALILWKFDKIAFNGSHANLVVVVDGNKDVVGSESKANDVDYVVSDKLFVSGEDVEFHVKKNVVVSDEKMFNGNEDVKFAQQNFVVSNEKMFNDVESTPKKTVRFTYDSDDQFIAIHVTSDFSEAKRSDMGDADMADFVVVPSLKLTGKEIQLSDNEMIEVVSVKETIIIFDDDEVPIDVVKNHLLVETKLPDVDFSGETSVARCMKFFFEQQIFDRRRFINHMREEVQTSTNLLGQLNALIVELEVFPDPGEVFDTLMCLRDDVHDEQARLHDLNDCITRTQEHIEIKEEHVRVMEADDNDVWSLLKGPSFLLDKLSEVTGSPRLGDKMKYVFGRSRSEDESLRSLMRSLCSGLRVSLSNKRRLVAELEALGESEVVAKSLDHIRVIVGRDAVTLGELEALLARAQVGAALKTGFVADMEVQE
ncbi:hypothetical protein Tco_0111967 [Tanacetum coccineum]